MKRSWKSKLNPDAATRRGGGAVPGGPTITRILYQWGLVDNAAQARNIPARVMIAPDIPAEVLTAIEREDLLRLGGVYGDPSWGEPIECDILRVEHAGGCTEIQVFNRSIQLFHADSEVIRRIHRVCESIRLARQVEVFFVKSQEQI